MRFRIVLVLCSLVAALALLPTVTHAQTKDTSLDRLLSDFSNTKTLTAEFVEVKRMTLLTQPLRSTGTILFKHPNALRRNTTKPLPSSWTIVDDAVQLVEDGVIQTISLKGQKSATALIDALVGVLSGDPSRLKKNHKLAFTPESKTSEWQLILKPKHVGERLVFSEMTIRGRGVVLASLVVKESNGDVATTTFNSVKTNIRLTEEQTPVIVTKP